VYKLQDNKNESLFERSVAVIPGKPSVLFSLPVPHEKLSLGTTALKIVARHREQSIASSLNIRANFGYHPKRVQNFTILIGPMRFIMSKNEYEELVNATPERQSEIFNAYWGQRNPNPGAGSNPLLEEFYYRVETANARFGWAGGEGFETDRGRIMIKYGSPDAVQNTSRPGSTIAYEIWTYYEPGRRFIFVDKYNDGNYQLLSGSGA
jgi:GWxTD domain-containing protein